MVIIMYCKNGRKSIKKNAYTIACAGIQNKIFAKAKIATSFTIINKITKFFILRCCLAYTTLQDTDKYLSPFAEMNFSR